MSAVEHGSWLAESPCAGASRSPRRTRRRSPTASRSSSRRRWSGTPPAKRRHRPRSGPRKPRRRWGASTSPRPRRSSPSAPRPTPRRRRAGEREARLMRWGLVPRWAKDLKVGYRMINAKAENLHLEPRLRAAGRQVPPPLPDRRRRLLRVDEGRGPEAAAPALALHRRRRRALRLRRHLHPQGVGGRGGPGRRGRLALQLHDRHDDAERGRRQGPRPDAGDPAPARRPRRPGCGPTSRSRTRSRCARRCPPSRMESAPANPKLNKVGKGIEGPELLVAS